MSNATKNAALGESYGAANNRLKKNIMFKLMQQLELDTCFQCGNVIDSVEHLSVEHKVPWLSAPDPKASFFDLNNIAFSHLKCNSGASTGGIIHAETTRTSKEEKARGRRERWRAQSDETKEARYQYIKEYRRRNPTKFQEYERRRG